VPAIRFWLILVALLWLGSLAAAGIYFVTGLRSSTTPPSYFTAEQVREGSIAYAQHCASCHGADLQGGSAPALVGERFWNNWGDKIVAALYEYTSHWMPQGRGGSLSEAIYADSVAYMLAQNGLPSGEEGLEPDSSRLTSLVIREALATNTNTRENPSPTSVDVADTSDANGNSMDAVSELSTESELSEEASITTLVGQTIYDENCARCHGEDGDGGIGPSLVNNPRLEDAAWTIRRIAIGGLGMPAYAYRLSNEEIADVTSYIRANFENSYEAVTSEQAASVVEQLPETDLQPVVAELETAPIGQQRFTQLCTACHGLQGGGGVGPPLAGNSNVADEQNVITILLYGRGEMPGFAQYGDNTIAEIASYIRTEWGNHYGTISEAQVQAYRTSSSGRTLEQNTSTPQSPEFSTNSNQNQTTENTSEETMDDQPSTSSEPEISSPTNEGETPNEETGGEE
jgi:mono/diheme cytochrome c family protein